jgi:hypothetical protein
VTKAIALESEFVHSQGFERRAFATVSLYAAWEEYSRRLVYSSAYARPRAGSGSGRKVARAPGISTSSDVDVRLRKLKRTQPQYRLILHLGPPVQMVKTCQFLALTNEQVISPAILSQNSPAEQLRLIRNFLAHQNPDTADQVPLGPFQLTVQMTTATSWLAEKQAGGRTRFGVWVSDLADIARACAN